MSVVRNLTKLIVLTAVAILGLANMVQGEPVRTTSWRLTGNGAVKRDLSGPFGESVFARLFDRKFFESSRFNSSASASPAPAPAPDPAPPPPPPPPVQPSASVRSPEPPAPPRQEPSGLVFRPVQTNLYDAFVNFGPGPYMGEDLLTVGGSSPWYTSAVIQKHYGGTPNGDQQRQFVNDVMAQVASTYAKSGLNVELTTDPSANASHMQSVVANTEFGSSPQAVGIAALGYYGFTFLDKFTPVQNLEQLKTAVAHNISHELMHSFGVDHIDKTGRYLDSAITSWEVMVDPNATFGSDAVNELRTKNFKERGYYPDGGHPSLVFDHQVVTDHESNYCIICGQGAANLSGDLGIRGQIFASPVPEPASLIAWGAVVVGLSLVSIRRRGGRVR